MILKSWKDIAEYLGCGVRTAQRWEKLGMPVRRPRKGIRSAAVALSEELEGWLKKQSTAIESSRPDPSSASPRFRYRVLLVDDDEMLLVTLAARLAEQGYDIRTARDGFEALAAMREGTPDLLISDLKMPNMSGFELLSIVRRRFPAMAVIAHTGEFEKIGNTNPLCDRYVQKGANSAFELLEAVRELLFLSPLRAQPAKVEVAPTWLPRSINGYFVLTCPDCLRSFSVMTVRAVIGDDAKVVCAHCGVEVKYHIEKSALPIQDARTQLLQHSRELLASSQASLQRSKVTLHARRKKRRRRRQTR